ncbi:16S rRNA (cytosine(967)-C(5))-methyltransferase RsmB [Marinobacterium sp. LSUCC0821]|uniref:16S rRNA (cytosine(967)-C(5))-methyltransferase RsmB n=1 Tax=Marinobacterium sp. LSUCC0821 TaxID=2668067 RepID=UPI0014526D82|nr:16S rRNA (cytosine(967)-C(5))-methyltransferase RsmB [Marinobacterium sp. LSUCC0821]QJD71844.1 16S rRNA (cytosine(967)-C(5))-methyltransferase RsmB [Marinobacterium sp. LSUCC0821]
MSNSYNLRALIAQLLTQLLQHQGSIASRLPAALAQVEGRDKALFQEICYGTFRYQPQLDALSQMLLRKPFRDDDLDIYALLISALYQIRHLSVGEHAVINETVEAAKQFDKPWAGKLLNAVLRRYQRESESLEATLKHSEVAQWNHPEWMIAKLKNNWPDRWQAILASNDQSPPMCLRVNRQKVEREAYIQQLADAGIESRAGQFSTDAIYLQTPCGVDKLPGFFNGLVSVQDEAAQLAAQLLAPKSGERVLDACAAPGGKLCHLLEHTPDIEIEAVELEPRRAPRIEENLERLGQQAALIIGDAATKDWWSGEPYDRILVDAPCSATGVIRRNPDIKALRRNEDIVPLANTQLAILDNLWDMLKPGGTLLYATCSIFPQENERVVERFLKDHIDASELKIDADWGVERPRGRQLFAQESWHDGFYYACLTRAEEA